MTDIAITERETNPTSPPVTHAIATHAFESCSSEPSIFYALIAFNTDLVVEVNEYSGARDDAAQFIKASQKILRRLKRYEIRRPDGMSTLIGGALSYNFILGYEYCNHEVHPLLDSITFLCVLPLHRYNRNVTSSEREIAFKFLSSMRRDFLTSFLEKLYAIHNHPRLNCIAARIDGSSQSDEDEEEDDRLNEEDENLRTNLRQLSQVMQQRMHGRYTRRFRYQAMGDTNGDDDDDGDGDGDDADELDELDVDDDMDGTVTLDLDAHIQVGSNVDGDNEEEYVNLQTPMKNNDSRSSSQSQSGQSRSTSGGGDHGFVTVDAMENNYGSVLNESTETRTSHSNVSGFFNDSFVDVTRRMRDRMRASMSATSLKSLVSNTALSEDKFVDFETMPLIGSSVNIMSGPYGADYYEYEDGRRSQTFLCRHRNKLGGFTVACLLFIYFVIAMFCGWNVQSCVP